MHRFALASQFLSYPMNPAKEMPKDSSALSRWLHEEDLYAVQEHYVEVFDRNPNCSLYLFEHVHGDSKQRGAALLDLKEMYEKEGWSQDSSELPDYLPVFLEFLSLLPEEKSLPLLRQVNHILFRIASALQKMNSPYYELVQSLVTGEVQKILSLEEVDLDQKWEEVPVTFTDATKTQLQSGGCR